MGRSRKAVRLGKRIRRLRRENQARRRAGLSGSKLLQGFADLARLERRRINNTTARAAGKAVTCMVVGCEAKHHAKGLCAKHYKRFRRLKAKENVE